MGVNSLFNTLFETPSLVGTLCAGLLVLYVLGGIVYRLRLSPLSNIPGPKLAAATHWVEFYYDVVKRGQYVFKIQEWHQQYGPIIRINPNEVHIHDAEFLQSSVFTANFGKRREKYEVSTRVFGSPQAAIATVDHDKHRQRRSAMGRYFSKENVRRVEDIIWAKMDHMLSRMRAYQQSGHPLTISLLYSAFTADVITEYAFAKSTNYLDMPDLNKKFFDMMVGVHEMGAAARQFSWIMPTLNALPQSLVEKLDSGMHEFFVFQDEVRGRIREVMAKNEHYEKLSHPTVFHKILESDLPPSEKTVDRLWQDAQIASIAGTETTAWTLAVITYYLLAQPETLRRLRAELSQLPERPSWRDLEALPYLTGVIQEGIRLSFGVTSRLSRCCPDETIRYSDGRKEYILPPGTPIATSAPLYHVDPSAFPNPMQFEPDRWTGDNRQYLDKYLWSFSKGSRQCMGMNLAYAELYLCLAGVFGKYGGPGDKGMRMELFGTDKSDVAFLYDLFVAYPKKESEGIRVLVKDD